MLVLDLNPLKSRGYARMTYPGDLRAGVRDAMWAWRAFCALTPEQKSHVSYSGDLHVSGVGYEHKIEPGATKDLKEDFHLRVSKRKFLMGEAAKVGPVAEEFVQSALRLNQLAIPLIRDFARGIEDQFAMPGFLEDTIDKEPEALIRFLHYFGGRDPGDEMAVPHPDKGGFTLHLYESHPGLEYFSHDGTWKPMEFSAGETAIIPAMRMQLRSKGALTATYHRVVANKQSAKKGRFSAVIFVDFSKTPYYDKAKFGRLQDQPHAFNYGMPHETLEGYFKPHEE